MTRKESDDIIRFCCKNCFVVLEAEPRKALAVLNCPQCNTQLKVPNESKEMFAKTFLSASRSFSTISITSIDEKLPQLWELTSEDDWVFFSSSAIISSSILLEKNGELRAWRIQGILQQFNLVDQEVNKAIKDFVDHWLKIKNELKVDEHIGMWLLTNLKGSKPTTEEVQNLSKPLSLFVLQQALAFKNNFNSLFEN